MDKKQVRQQQIQRLTALSQQPQLKQAQSQQLYQQLFATSMWQQAQCVALTYSQGIELATQPVIQQALATGKTVYLPRVMPQRQMAFMPYQSTTPLIQSKFGLQEPAFNEATATTTFDLMLVPGLAFVPSQHIRLGFGGGYYDRFLAKHPQQTISLVLPVQQLAKVTWPIDPFDQKVQTFLTIGK